MAFEPPEREPRPTHYIAPRGPGRWHFEAWQRRRAVKVGEPTEIRKIAKFYEEITPRIYRNNMKVAENVQPGGMPYRLSIIHPEKLPNRAMDKKVTNRELRGGSAAKKRRGFRTKALKNVSALSKGLQMDNQKLDTVFEKTETAEEDSEWIDTDDEGDFENMRRGPHDTERNGEEYVII